MWGSAACAACASSQLEKDFVGLNRVRSPACCGSKSPTAATKLAVAANRPPWLTRIWHLRVWTVRGGSSEGLGFGLTVVLRIGPQWPRDAHIAVEVAAPAGSTPYGLRAGVMTAGSRNSRSLPSSKSTSASRGTRSSLVPRILAGPDVNRCNGP